MFITRKRLEEMLEKARESGKNEIALERDRERQLNYVHERVNDLEKRLNRYCDELEVLKHGEVLDGSPKNAMPVR